MDEGLGGLQGGRRDFLRQVGIMTSAAAVAGGLGAAEASPTANEGALPTIRLGEHRVTRLIAGYNPVGGFSHATPNLSQHMRNYFTVERTVDFLRHCEAQGINAFQFDLSEKTEKALEILREGGTHLRFICLHSERSRYASLEEVMAHQPIAVAHHGGVTDSLFRDGKAQQVHDYVKRTHDLGALACVSSHNPAHIARMADEGWENDFFMACFYHLSRTREEMERELGFATVGEPFLESDPEKMTAVIRQIDKPFLAFKILAAGRRCANEKAVASAFKRAFEQIKKTDAVIVGMYPAFQDEVSQNVALAKQYGSV